MKILARSQPGLLLAALLISTSAQAVSTVNKSISIPDGGHEDSISSVNGAITVGAGASVGTVKSVNGSVRLGENVLAESVSSVNGSVRMGAHAQIKDDIRVVNSDLDIAPAAQVGGDLTTVNGTVRMDHAVIKGMLTSASASVETGTGSAINGGIHVEKRSHGDNSRPPEITIGPETSVGDITAEREIVLHISRRAHVGKISGASAIWTE